MKNVLKISAALLVFSMANTAQAQISVGSTLKGSTSSTVNSARIGSAINNTTTDVVNRASATTRNEVNKTKSLTDNASQKANAAIRENRKKSTEASLSGQTSTNGQVQTNSAAHVEVRSDNNATTHHDHNQSGMEAQHSSETNVSVSDAQVREEAKLTSDRTKTKIKGAKETATKGIRNVSDQAKGIQPSATVNTQVSGGLKTGR